MKRMQEARLSSCHRQQKLKSLLSLLLILISMVALSACNDDLIEKGAKGQSPKEAPPTLTPAEQRKQAEESLRKAEEEEMAKIPTFDHGDTLEGPDANGDGVRDDIEKYIDGLDLPEEKKEALKKFALVLRKVMLANLDDEEEAQKVAMQISLVVDCLAQRFKDSPEAADQGYAYLKIIQAAAANTEARTKKYIEFNLKASGGVYRLTSGGACEQIK